MQPSSDLPQMSQGKKSGRRVELRQGQIELLNFLHDNPNQGRVNVEFPVAYGKTWALLLAYDFWRKRGEVDRLLIVVPQTEQLKQYLDKLKEHAAILGIHLRGIKKVDGDTITLRYHNTNKAEVFVMMVHWAATDIGLKTLDPPKNLGFLNDLMSTGKWMFGVDEAHHYAHLMAWGKALLQIRAARTITLSGTPRRRDGKYGVFGEPHIRVTLRQAREEMAIKKVVSHVEHYFVDVEDKDGNRLRLTTESLREEDDFSTYEKRRSLRYDSGYCCSMLSNAASTLIAKQLRDPEQHRMLVYAMSCKHAKFVAEQFAALPFDLRVDWIGTGPDGREERANDAAITAFKQGELDVLVQVDKIGEGFDLEQVSVEVFLSLIGETPKAMQEIGRALRRNPVITNYDNDCCDLYVPADSAMADFVKDLESEIEAKKPREGSGGGSNGDIPFPSWEVIMAKHDRSELFFPLEGGKQALRERALEYLEEVHHYDTNNPLHRERLEADLSEFLDKLIQKKLPQPSDDEKLRQHRTIVHRAVGSAAAAVCRCAYGGSFEKSIIGRVANQINLYWKMHVCGHEAMTIEEFKQKYEWALGIRTQALSGEELPRWLRV